MRRHTIKLSAALAAAAILAAGCGDGGGAGGGRRASGSAGKPEKELPPVRTGVNLIENRGFEEWDGSQPVGWDVKIFSGDGNKTSYYGKSDSTRSGDHCLYIRGLFDTERIITVTQRHPVRPRHKIEFSADIRVRGVERNRGQDDNAGVYVIFYDAEGNRIDDRNWADAWTHKRMGTGTWRVSGEDAEAPDGAYWVELGLINQMTGYVFFDSVRLVIKEKVDWESREEKYIVYNWFESRPFPEEAMRRQSRLLEAIAEEAGIDELDGKIQFYLYPDEETFMRVLERPKYRTAARWDRKELHEVITYNDHEILHLLLYDLGFPPVALSKGFVFYFRAKHNNWDMEIRSKRFLLQRKIPALYKTIDPKRWRVADHSIVVPAWASFVRYLIEEYGMDRFLELYRKTNGIKEPGPFSARFKDVYGKGFQEMDRDWRLHIMRYQGDAAADTLPDSAGPYKDSGE